MTSTPISNDESLNGSWIDINSASQIHSPIGQDSPEYLRPPHSVAESVQDLGIISFQVERFLKEAQVFNESNNGNNNNNLTTIDKDDKQDNLDMNISDMYLSDSDVSIDDLEGTKLLIHSLRKHQRKYQSQNQCNNGDILLDHVYPDATSGRLSKSGESLMDQLSDSLSMLSRASLMADAKFDNHFNLESRALQLQDFDWLWDWTGQPEYFSGQEWKVGSSKQQRSCCSSLNSDRTRKDFPGDVVSLLVLTNILSILIGAGLTYGLLMNRSNA